MGEARERRLEFIKRINDCQKARLLTACGASRDLTRADNDGRFFTETIAVELPKPFATAIGVRLRIFRFSRFEDDAAIYLERPPRRFR